MRTSLTVFLCQLLIAASAPARGDDPGEILSRLQKKYDTVRDASIEFSRTVQFAALRTEQSSAGKFYMKRGNRYRIEGDEQTIVTDGTTVWTYTRATGQVMIDAYREDTRALTPDNLFVNVPKQYRAALVDDPQEKGTSVDVLKLLPADEHAPVKWMKVWVDTRDWLMHRVQIEDPAENLTTYRLNAIRLNLDLPDSLFRFTPPAGADVIDLR
ncbi:MAG TPA: outer membrane lipoprotein carrier protein LolA [Bacteroidota bacterium]|nr:outer membrane lipoprotein carrier protein LolA [Bacteroidota bacterium]